MATPVIKIKRNNSGSTPTSLVYGELAADISNKKLYIGDSAGSPILIGLGTSSSGTPLGTNGEIQIGSSTGFSNALYFQLLNNSSIFLNNSSKVNIPISISSDNKNILYYFNNIFLENEVIKVKVGTGSTASYLLKNKTGNSLKLYSLPTTTGDSIGTTSQQFTSSAESPIQIYPYTNSATPVCISASLQTFNSTFTCSDADFNQLALGMQLTSGVRPIILNRVLVNTSNQNTVKVDYSSSNISSNLVNSYVEILGQSSKPPNWNGNDVTMASLPNDTYISNYSTDGTTKTLTLSASFVGTFIAEKTDTYVDLIIYPTGAIRPNTFITYLDSTATPNKKAYLNKKLRAAATNAANVTLYLSYPERQNLIFGTPIFKHTNISTNENISLTKQLTDAGRNLEQKITFNSSESFSIKINSWTGSATQFTLTVPENIIELNTNDLLLSWSYDSGTTLNTASFNYITSIDYVLKKITLNSAIGTSGTTYSNVYFNIRPSRFIKSIIEHKAFPYGNNALTNSTRFLRGNYPSVSLIGDSGSGVEEHNSNSFSLNQYSNGADGTYTNLGSYNDMGLYICSDTSIKIGLSPLTRGSNYENNYTKEPVDTAHCYISIEPTISSSSTLNGIFFKNLETKSSGSNASFYVLGCNNNFPRRNDGANYLIWYKLTAQTLGLVGDASGGLVYEQIDEDTTKIKLADEVPINTSLTVPLIKGTSGGDLNITTESADSNIVISIPQSNTDVVLSTGNVYITSGLDAGDVYVQSAEDIYLTSQSTRVSGNLIIDGYVQVGNGIIGDTTDGEEQISGLYLDGGSF